MESECAANEAQRTLWNGAAGRAWVETQALLDELFQPLQDLLVESLPAAGGGRLLDVGCGTGGTTLAFARRLGPGADCVGVDISAPMIELARLRSVRECSSAHFVCADAQVHAFEPDGFDMIVSRFGVMFFDDPVRAFAALRRAAREGALLKFVAWRSAAENAFMTEAERAAAPLLPDFVPRPSGGPGQFAFADPGKVSAILQDSGWRDVDIQRVDAVCTMPEAALLHYLGWMGPVGAHLQQADPRTRDKVLTTLRAAFEPYVHGSKVCFTAACWMVGARAA